MRLTNSPWRSLRSKSLTTTRGPVRRRDRPCSMLAESRGSADPRSHRAARLERRRGAAPARCRRARRRRVCWRADVEQVLDDLGAQRLEARVVVERLAVARARDVDRERRAERGAGPGAERDDAVGEQDGLVDVVGDRARWSCRSPARCARSRPAAWRGSARRARRAARPAAAPPGPSPGRAPRATRWRMPPESCAGLLVARAARGSPSRCTSRRAARLLLRRPAREAPGRRPGARSRSTVSQGSSE